jgi:hypothetical protein
LFCGQVLKVKKEKEKGNKRMQTTMHTVG